MCHEQMDVEFGIALSHVCRTWREHVLAMPLLWNHLKVDQPNPRWAQVAAQLERSDQAPLDISIHNCAFRKSAIPRVRELMRLILPHLNRWRSLSLLYLPYKIKRIIWDNIRGKSAPLLKQIRMGPGLDRMSGGRTQCSWNARNILDGFQNLEDVEWAYMGKSHKSVPTFIKLRRLIVPLGTLKLSNIPFVHLIRQILTDSPTLETLEIFNGPLNQEESTNAVDGLDLPLLTHHTLRELRIEGGDRIVRIRSAIVRSLVLPKLQRFADGYHYLDALDLSSCKTIAKENSLPALRALSITGDLEYRAPSFHASKPFLPAAIHNLVKLRVLTLSDINFDSRRWLPNLGSSCPHLRWLLIIYCVGYDIPSIRAIVKNRIDNDEMTPLDHLVIEPDEDAPSECKVYPADQEWFSSVLDFKFHDDRWYIYGRTPAVWQLGDARFDRQSGTFTQYQIRLR
ncbi:hypothetical protein FRB90_004468 [Tulasnella sp. 427]|nr:hypothetical protein FRB90_004468 [Tulasnella sp. 427]